jgi:hypothetical protein
VTRARLDPCAIQVSGRDRAHAFCRDGLGAEAIPRGACRLGPVPLDAQGPGVRAAPGNSDLCFAWDGTLAETRPPLARPGVAVDLGPAPRNGARGAGVSLCFRHTD